MLARTERAFHDDRHSAVLDRDKWDRLREIVHELSFSEGETKRLSSGVDSNFYFNMKRTMSEPEALELIADLMLQIIDEDCDFVGGLEMGAVPILNVISLRSQQLGRPVPLFWIRKKAKEHGTMDLLEGQEIEDLRGKTAIMVDDVTTTGGSVLKAIKEARSAGVKISRVITIVDRLEGAAENLKASDIELTCVFDANDFRKK